MTDTVYIVYGSTGEYSDHQEWPVLAFLSEKDAQEFIAEVTKKAAELKARGVDNWDIGKHPEMQPLDPNYQEDYTGTSYSYWSVKFRQ